MLYWILKTTTKQIQRCYIKTTKRLYRSKETKKCSIFKYRPVTRTVPKYSTGEPAYEGGVADIRQVEYSYLDSKDKVSKYALTVEQDFFLMHKSTLKKIDIMTAPIPCTEEFRRQLAIAEASASLRLSRINGVYLRDVELDYKNVKESLVGKIKDNLIIPEGFEDITKEYYAAWAKRLEASGGEMIMQFNLKTSIFKDVWIRSLQPMLDEYMNNGTEKNHPRISWLGYFLRVLTFTAKKTYVNLNNWYYRKEIKKEEKMVHDQLNNFRNSLGGDIWSL